MRKLSLLIIFFVLVVQTTSVALSEAKTQGLYEGMLVDAKVTRNVVARVVALGNSDYKVFIQNDSGENDEHCVELAGKVKGDAVVFKGAGANEGWFLSCANGEVKGTSASESELVLKRVEKKSPTLGKKPVAGAIILLDGMHFDEIKRSDGRDWSIGDESQEGWGVWEVTISTVAKKPAVWPTEDNLLPEGWKLTKRRVRAVDMDVVAKDGSIQVPQKGMQSMHSINGSFDYHVEFRIPLRASARSQGRGNSGVFFPCGTEIQVLDSFGIPTYKGGGCGGLYKWKDPDTMQLIPSMKNDKKENKFNLASLPPLEW